MLGDLPEDTSLTGLSNWSQSQSSMHSTAPHHVHPLVISVEGRVSLCSVIWEHVHLVIPVFQFQVYLPMTLKAQWVLFSGLQINFSK